MPSDSNVGRRTFIKGAGGAAAGATLAGRAAAKVDDGLELSDDPQEAIVIFESRDDVDRLGDLSLAEGYYKYKALPFGYTTLTGQQIRTVAGWPEVEYVQGNHEIEWHNEDARGVTDVQAVQESGYTGETVHVAVIDGGIQGDHPAFVDTLEANYRFANPFSTEMWVDVGPADTEARGHGTHVSGTITGEQNPSDRGQDDYGMAPDASLSVYSTTIGQGLVGVTGAYDDIVDKQRRGVHDIQVINNSYGAASGNDYDPAGAHERATWAAYEEGIVSVFSAGNAGSDPNTMGDYAAGPHVLSSAATTDLAKVTDFSSRGRAGDKPEYADGANWDRKTALEQVEAFYNAGLTGEDTLVHSVTRTGTLGAAGAGLLPVVQNPDSPVTGSSYERIEAPSSASLLTLSVGWTPDADNDVYLRKGSQDGEVVASATTFTGNPETIRTQVEGGTTYWVEIRPFLNAVSEYTLEGNFYDVDTAAIPDRPYGLHRPAVGTPGNWIMSTLGPADAWQAYPAASAVLPVGSNPDTEIIRNQQAEAAQEPLYGLLSGTSMSAPVLTGIVALVYDAYRQNHLEWPDPTEVILTIEATAEQIWESHNQYNIGAGFADARAAVKRAMDGDLVSPSEYDTEVDLATPGASDLDGFVATGSRTDDATAYTAGQTVRVDVEVVASKTAVVRDRIPEGWRVLEAGDQDRVEQDGPDRFVIFEDVPDANDGSAATLTYFVEVPLSAGETGPAEFGPAEARAADGDEFTLITGTDTNLVAGVDQNEL